MTQTLRMKSTAMIFLAAAAWGCKTVPMGTTRSVGPGTSTSAINAPSGSASTNGASSPKGAVEMMLTAAKMQDIQALSAVWGDEKGMTRDRVDRNELETRSIDLICLLKHDSEKIGDPVQASGSRYIVPTELIQGTNSASTNFTVAKSSAGRWLVTTFDVVSLQNKGFCKRTGQ